MFDRNAGPKGAAPCGFHPETRHHPFPRHCYGISCVGVTIVPSRVNSNCRVQLLKTPRPPTFGGLNFQSCAASSAARAKYLLGPRGSGSGPATLTPHAPPTLSSAFWVYYRPAV